MSRKKSSLKKQKRDQADQFVEEAAVFLKIQTQIRVLQDKAQERKRHFTTLKIQMKTFQANLNLFTAPFLTAILQFYVLIEKRISVFERIHY